MIDIKQGDCLKLMKEIPDKSIDMILCDLPYGTTKNKWDNIISFDTLWKEYERIIKDNGAIVLFGDGMFSAKLMMSNSKLWRYKFCGINNLCYICNTTQPKQIYRLCSTEVFLSSSLTSSRKVPALMVLIPPLRRQPKSTKA